MNRKIEPLQPILTAHLFPKVDGMLIELLRSLGPADWEKQTVSPRWKVKDVAAHLLAEFHASRDPYALAPYGVSWAGEEKSTNWFDTAREFTERWHHQQQIRLAVNKPGIMTRELYYPVLDCFLRALPFTYRAVSGRPETYAHIIISGPCGGSWYLCRAEETWRLLEEPFGEKVSETTIPQEIAWRIFTKGIDRESALSEVKVEGDIALGTRVLGMISIVAQKSDRAIDDSATWRAGAPERK